MSDADELVHLTRAELDSARDALIDEMQASVKGVFELLREAGPRNPNEQPRPKEA